MNVSTKVNNTSTVDFKLCGEWETVRLPQRTPQSLCPVTPQRTRLSQGPSRHLSLEALELPPPLKERHGCHPETLTTVGCQSGCTYVKLKNGLLDSYSQCKDNGWLWNNDAPELSHLWCVYFSWMR